MPKIEHQVGRKQDPKVPILSMLTPRCKQTFDHIMEFEGCLLLEFWFFKGFMGHEIYEEKRRKEQ